MLAGDADAIDLGGQRREIATLFTDIANFTALVETLEPDALGPLLNDYLTGMTDLVFSYDGTVAKIVGDALHVLFGAPGEQADHAARAVNCALALDAYAQVNAGSKKGSHWESHVLVLMQGRRSLAISAGVASSTTQPTVIP